MAALLVKRKTAATQTEEETNTKRLKPAATAVVKVLVMGPRLYQGKVLMYESADAKCTIRDVLDWAKTTLYTIAEKAYTKPGDRLLLPDALVSMLPPETAIMVRAAPPVKPLTTAAAAAVAAIAEEKAAKPTATAAAAAAVAEEKETTVELASRAKKPAAAAAEAATAEEEEDADVSSSDSGNESDDEDSEMGQLMSWLDVNLDCNVDPPFAAMQFVMAMGQGNHTFDDLVKYASHHAQARKPNVFNVLLKRAKIVMTPAQRRALGDAITEMRKFETEH